jgi:PAS domain S-box-containing protein
VTIPGFSVGQLTPRTSYTAILAVTALALVGLAVWVVRSVRADRGRARRTATLVAGILLTTALWCLAYGLQLSSTDQSTALLWNNVRVFGPTVASPLTFLFVASYTGRERWFRWPRLVGVFAVAAVTNVLAWTNHLHGLVWETILQAPGNRLYTDTVPAAWGYVYPVVDYLFILGGLVMLLGALREHRRSRLYRGQVVTMIVAIVLPTVLNALWFLGVIPFDATPLGVAGTGVMFAVAFHRYRLLDILPVARSTVIENVDMGAVVLDADGTIVDANPAAGHLVGATTLVGRTVEDVLAAYPETAGRLREREAGSERISVALEESTRWFDVDVTPLEDGSGREVGRVLLFNDVTEQVTRQRELRQRTAELERRNEQLDRFASIVSHDLRNPLTVATGHLTLAREDPTAEHFDAIEGSLDRMATIIDDVLAIARQSHEPAVREEVDLEGVIEDAWSQVDTGQAAVETDLDGTISADVTRLRQVFENLFRNAIDHGPTDVTVRVGPLDPGENASAAASASHSGFFVEDDGPGIPPEDRQAVFERGFSTADDGTGLGLSIVEAAVEAHGWTIEVTESGDGGARFEIRIA